VELQHASVASAMLIYQGLPVYVTLGMAAYCPAVCYAMVLVGVAQDQAQIPV
jgi:hypothetical protein